MTNTKIKIKDELNALKSDAYFFYNYICLIEDHLTQEDADRLRKQKKYSEFVNATSTITSFYQRWFSKALRVVTQLLPDRSEEFKKLYSNEKRDVKKITNLTYLISDYLIGLKVKNVFGELPINGPQACISKLEQQIGIIESCIEIVDSKLYDIEATLQYELFEDELNTAKLILKKKGVRIAGALAGITLETHLKKVCKNHNIILRKSNPTIAEYNDELKNNSIIEVPTWRLIQRLGDIRNLSVHAKDREPTIDEVNDLIHGTEKLIVELA